MRNNILIRVPGLEPNEQKKFIYANLRDNIQRLKVAGLAFLLIEVTMLIYQLIRNYRNTSQALDIAVIYLYVGISLFLSLFLLFLVYMGRKATMKNMAFFRLTLITGMMLVLLWGVFLVLMNHDSGFLPSAYILIMMSIAVIPYLSFWEITLTMIPSQAFITILLLAGNIFPDEVSTGILFDSWSFCFISIVVSTLFYSFRISNFKKDIQLSEQNSRLRQHSEIDSLTGIYNRRKMDEIMAIEWNRSGRSRKPLSFLLIDLDYFKKFNDTYGHVEGDLCLRKAASIMSGTLKRSTDAIFRYGGEEFGVILPFTSMEAARIVAEKLKKNIENARIVHEHSKTGFLTISIGISAATGSHESSYEQLCLEADKALYAAKKSGRNRVICYDG